MKVTRNLRLLAFVTLLCAWKTTIATIDFQNLSSRLVFDNNTSLLLIKNQQKILGWSKLSIVKENGNVPATNWIEGYSNNVIIGPSGATKVPQTNLVIANSNAITYLGPFVPLTPVPTADTINGSLWVQYKTKHHVFHNNGNAWTSRGFVRFNDGFTIMPLASVIMDTVTSVSGGMDLRDTGTLILAGDLYLAHNVTLTSGGNIKGRTGFNGPANTIFMGGDLTLSAFDPGSTAVLYITGDWSSSGTSGDIIIDGCGHTLNIGDYAKLFVETNVTLTLRNMTIKTGPKSSGTMPIQLAAHGSKLTLDNVLLDLGADYYFTNGQLFIHNEVAVTGTSAFIYTSPKPSYITSGATWSFEQGTTFSVAPATFTDCPYTVNNTFTNNAFLTLADASSSLSLNGCTLKTTFTGLRLSRGMILFDNKVAIDTQAAADLATTATTPITFLRSMPTASNFASAQDSLKWSPDGRFLAAIGGNYTEILKFNGNSNATSLGTVTGGRCLAWSPDGRFLAVEAGGPIIYRFNGNGSLVTICSRKEGKFPTDINWSPDGKLLVVPDYGLSNNDNFLRIYQFGRGGALSSLGTISTSPYNCSFAYFSPDGRFLAVCTTKFPDGLWLYRFNGKDFPTLVGTASTVDVPLDGGAAWSPDGRFLAVATLYSVAYSTPLLMIYRCTNTGLVKVLGTGVATGPYPCTPVWSPDGRFVAIGSKTSAPYLLQICSFDGASLNLLYTQPMSKGVISLAWSPDGKYLAAMPHMANYGNIWLFGVNYFYTGQPSAAQSFTNGLLFGDKVKGPNFNANVQVLDGATVTVKGMVSDDSA